MRSVATRLGNPYADRPISGSPIALMRGLIQEAHSDAATPQLSLQLCVRGQYEVTADIGAGRFRARRGPGDMIVGPPNQEITLSGGSKNGIEMLILALDWRAVAPLLDGPDAIQVGEFANLRCGLVRDAALNALLHRLWDCPGLTENHLCGDELTQDIVAHLLRLLKAPARPLCGGLAQWQMKRVMEVMRARLAEDIRLNELAGIAGLSPFHFTRAFRTAAGRTPHQMLVQLRIERAEQLLIATKRSILEIALEVGYGSGQAFARAFKRIHGVTPEYYRGIVG